MLKKLLKVQICIDSSLEEYLSIQYEDYIKENKEGYQITKENIPLSYSLYSYEIILANWVFSKLHNKPFNTGCIGNLAKLPIYYQFSTLMNQANALSNNFFNFSGKHTLSKLWELRYKPFNLKVPCNLNTFKNTIGDNFDFSEIIKMI